jgi:hypothetical protein
MGLPALNANLPRPCERKCLPKEQGGCGQWKHHSRFHSWQRKDNDGRNSTVAPVRFDPLCRDCQQKHRNEKKNLDRPRSIIEGRARTAAAKAGLSLEFFMTHMNYRALIPHMRAMMTSEGLCLSCGHLFDSERDIQVEHIEPPRSEQDLARLHARNIRLMCGSCNRTKSDKPFAQWLDEQEGARLSNLDERSINPNFDWQIDHKGQFEMYGAGEMAAPRRQPQN